MLMSMSTPTGPGELIVNRTSRVAYGPDSSYAVQVFLHNSFTSLYLTVDEARTLAHRLLDATAGDPRVVEP